MDFQDIRLSKNEIRNRNTKISKTKTENKFSKFEIEIQNVPKPKTENKFSKSDFLKTKPEKIKQILKTYLNPEFENRFSKNEIRNAVGFFVGKTIF